MRFRAPVARSRAKRETPCLDHVQRVHRHRLDEASDCAGGNGTVRARHPCADPLRNQTGRHEHVICLSVISEKQGGSAMALVTTSNGGTGWGALTANVGAGDAPLPTCLARLVQNKNGVRAPPPARSE